MAGFTNYADSDKRNAEGAFTDDDWTHANTVTYTITTSDRSETGTYSPPPDMGPRTAKAVASMFTTYVNDTAAVAPPVKSAGPAQVVCALEPGETVTTFSISVT